LDFPLFLPQKSLNLVMELMAVGFYGVFFPRFELLVEELKHPRVFLSAILHFKIEHSFLLLWLG